MPFISTSPHKEWEKGESKATSFWDGPKQGHTCLRTIQMTAISKFKNGEYLCLHMLYDSYPKLKSLFKVQVNYCLDKSIMAKPTDPDEGIKTSCCLHN